MAINRLQFGGLLNPKESFGWEEYGQPCPKITTPSLLGAGVLGDVTGKKLRTQRGLQCPAGTQPNASNTACVPIKKTGTCPAGTTGVWPNCTPIKVGGGTCPAGTTGVWPNCTRIKVGNGTDPTCASLNKVGTYPNCRDPITTTDQQCGDGEVGRWPNCRPAQNLTEDDLKNLFDLRTDDPTTVADVGRVRQDPLTGQTITSTGLGGDYRTSYSPYGAEERGQGVARGTWNPLSDPADLAARQAANLAAGGTLPQSSFTPVQPAAPLSTQDFLAAYSRPSKTVDQGILGLEAERAAVEEINRANQRASEFSNIWDVPDSPSVDQFEEAREREAATARAEEFAPSPRKVPVDEFADIKKQESKRTKERVESAKKDLAKIRKKQADEKKKSDEKMKELAELSRKASLAAVQDISGASKAQKARRQRAVSKSKSKSKSKKAIHT